MLAGFRDANGKFVAGTEVMHLLPHKGRLHAGTSLWMESDPSVPKACQVLVLDSPNPFEFPKGMDPMAGGGARVAAHVRDAIGLLDCV